MRRIGCYAGANADWNSPEMRLGIAKYARYANLGSPPAAATTALLEELKRRGIGFCPPQCTAREAVVGGHCVAKTCKPDEILIRRRRLLRQTEVSPGPQSSAVVSSRAGEANAGGALPRLQRQLILRVKLMAKKFIVAALLAFLAPSGIADAGEVMCNVPRALLCDGCASAIVVSFTPAGTCRIAFTPGTSAPTSEGIVPVTFVFDAPPQTRWLSRPKAPLAQPAPFTPPAGGRDRCLVFNGYRYCE